MAGNHVAANLLMLLLIIGGLIAANKITKEVFPSYDLDIINISMSYPGASPEEVEQGIILAVEEEIRSLKNIERKVREPPLYIRNQLSDVQNNELDVPDELRGVPNEVADIHNETL